jgi:NADH-quinone oxidoreductase subunit C
VTGPATPPPHPSVAALRARFGAAIGRTAVVRGAAIVWVAGEQAHDIFAWLRDDPDQRFDYLVDVTAVEYRDRERPLEVVYQLRSIPRNVVLRVKIELDPAAALEVDSVVDLWQGANWLEREVWDMFGIRFRGHPDHRRILMWETYDEGHPLRKGFPLRGRFSRAEQVRRALGADLAAHYSMDELSIADAYAALPADMRARLKGRTGAGPGDGGSDFEAGHSAGGASADAGPVSDPARRA